MSARISAEEQFARMLELSSPVGTGADPAVDAMARLAVALRAAGQSPSLPAPDPAFRSELRQRLVAVATVQNELPAARRPVSRLTSASHRMRRRAVALAGTVAITTSFAGVGVAAARSLPGDPFYTIKRATEAVQLWTARGDEAKGKRHLEFAQTRLAEARALSPDSSHIASALAAMDAETKAGSAELITAYQSSHSTAPLAELVTFTNEQVDGLTRLATKLPAELKAKETASLEVLGGLASEVQKAAHGVCIRCVVVPVSPGSSQRPSVKPSSHPGGHPSAKPSSHPHSGGPNAHVSSHPTQGPGRSSSGAPAPTKSSILPQPSSLLSSILHPKHTHSPLPIVSQLLGNLGLGGLG